MSKIKKAAPPPASPDWSPEFAQYKALPVCWKMPHNLQPTSLLRVINPCTQYTGLVGRVKETFKWPTAILEFSVEELARAKNPDRVKSNRCVYFNLSELEPA